jgi:hypothetical protein
MVTGYELWIDGYFHMSGGIRALHVLRDELVKRGMNAWMKYERHDPNAIAIYPEIIRGNPGNFDAITRWWLNTAEPTQDPTWAWETGMNDYPLLTVNIIELDMFKPRPGIKRGVAYWVGKGKKDERFIPDNAEEITRKNYTRRSALAERLASLDYLISFDPFTAVNVEAVVSGTPVLIRGQHHSMTAEDIEAHNWTPYGVSTSMEKLDEARSTVHLAREHYESLLPVFDQRVDDFVAETMRLYQ